MITNYDIRDYLANIKESNLTRNYTDEEFEIEYVDALRQNNNALMFLVKGNIDIIRFCEHCVILVSPDINVDFTIGSNNIIFINNPKYHFCRLINHFRIRSRFEYRNLPFIMLGQRCNIDDTVILGGEDFSPVLTDEGSLIQFPQFGGIDIGDDVTIKYYSMVGKGTFDYTIIGDNTMIDYNVQIGHNCKIGKRCIITAGVIIGGSTKIGDDVVIGIGAKIRNGITIGNNVSIGMGSVVTKDIPDNVVIIGNPARIIEHKHIFDEGGLK